MRAECTFQFTTTGATMMKQFFLCSLLVSAMFCTVAPAAAETTQPLNFHVVFEDRCHRCHGHAGPFVRDTLSLVDGVLVRPGGQPVEPFLKTHFGGLDRDTLHLFLDTFEAQLQSGALYREKCIFCHEPAYHFARLNLIDRDGTLTGRYSGHDIDLFLRSHGRLTAEEADRMTEALRALLGGSR